MVNKIYRLQTYSKEIYLVKVTGIVNGIDGQLDRIEYKIIYDNTYGNLGKWAVCSPERFKTKFELINTELVNILYG